MAEKNTTLTPRLVLQLAVFIGLVPLLPMIISGRWGWWQAWVYAAVNIVGFVVSRYLASRKHPDILQERAKTFEHRDALPWDQVLSRLSALGGGLLPVAAGLDARFNWSGDLGLPFILLGLLMVIGGYILGSWALIVNRYFSGVVRIQSDRGHRVVRGGPYRWVRHPGYAGALFSYLGTPLLLESAWTLVPVGVLMIILVVRTLLEDRTLQEQLEGYRVYTREVKYRLIPGVW